jgi:hypothetical protein
MNLSIGSIEMPCALMIVVSPPTAHEGLSSCKALPPSGIDTMPGNPVGHHWQPQSIRNRVIRTHEAVRRSRGTGSDLNTSVSIVGED